MITEYDENWHYLAVKSIPRLLREITSNNNGDFYCLNCFHSYRTKQRLKKMKRYAKIMIIVRYKCLTRTKKY